MPGASLENYYKTVIPEGFIYAYMPDQGILVDRFLAGEINVMPNVPVARKIDVRAADNVQVFEYAGGSWMFMALNHADPANPVDGFEMDDEGNPILDDNGELIPIEQPPHPIFGDVRVRRATQLALDLDEIAEKVLFGEATLMASYLLPSSWALDPDLDPVGYDPEAARALLAEAGWTDSDGDGILDKDGISFSFELMVSERSVGSRQFGELAQQQFSQIGIEMDLYPADFNLLVATIDSQSFDTYALGWFNSYPDDPDWAGVFTSDGDVVGSGFNAMSYNNPEVAHLFSAANNVPGCKLEDRAPLYHEIQQIMQEDQAYIWLFALSGLSAASTHITNWNPQPNQPFWNMADWVIND